jgi:succinoglycan biosynthesis transport protein ExoP
MKSQSDQAATSDTEGFTQFFGKYLAIFSKRKWVVIAAVALVTGATAAWTYTRVPVYQAAATVLVENRAPQVLGGKVGEVVDLSTGRFWEKREYRATQIRVIQSYRLARDVVERLSLASDPRLWKPEDPPKNQVKERAIARVQQMIKASPVRKSNIIRIRARHPDPKFATLVANTMVKVYLKHNLAYKALSTTGAVKWLADQLDSLKAQLEKAELALHEFMKKNNVIATLENKRSIVLAQIGRYSDALTEIRIKKLALGAKRRQLRKIGNDLLATPIKAINDDPTVQSLRASYEKARSKYDALLQRYGPKHPMVKDQAARLGSAKLHLSKQILAIRNGIETEYRGVADNERKLAAVLQKAKDKALAIGKREVVYRRLKRDQENTERLYTSVLSRMKTSELSAQLKFNNLRFLDEARVPKTPISPRVRISLMVGLFLGLLLGVAFAIVIDLLDNSVKSEGDILAIPGLVCLGMIPRVKGNQGRELAHGEADLICHSRPKSPAAESCRSIRTNLLFAATGRSLDTMVVTSPGPREGKTTTATSIAITMAQAGNTVLLVDSDMRRPRLHKTFAVPNTDGITSVLLGQVELKDAIRSTDVPNLFLLPCGPMPPNPAEICQSESFRGLLDNLKDLYDRVLLDSPPVGIVTDAAILSTMTDGALLVARATMTSRAGLREIYHRIADVGSTVLGCVLEDVDLDSRGYGYGRYGRYRYGGYNYYGKSTEQQDELA